jgi:hypothetical protein
VPRVKHGNLGLREVAGVAEDDSEIVLKRGSGEESVDDREGDALPFGPGGEKGGLHFSGFETSGFGDWGGTATLATVLPNRVVVPSLSAPAFSASRISRTLVISNAA